MLKVDLQSCDISTLHTLTGSYTEVDTAIAELLQRYPPEGFVTVP
jgi:hypothetical protein